MVWGTRPQTYLFIGLFAKPGSHVGILAQVGRGLHDFAGNSRFPCIVGLCNQQHILTLAGLGGIPQHCCCNGTAEQASPNAAQPISMAGVICAGLTSPSSITTSTSTPRAVPTAAPQMP